MRGIVSFKLGQLGFQLPFWLVSCFIKGNLVFLLWHLFFFLVDFLFLFLAKFLCFAEKKPTV